MKSKLPMLVAVLLNLLVWNYVASGSWGNGLFSMEYYIVVVHGTISSSVVLLLWLLERKFRRSDGQSILLLFSLSVLVAYLPPVIAMWLAYALPQLVALNFEDLSMTLVVAIGVFAMSWDYWVPLGIANYFLLRAHSRGVRSLKGNTANQPIKPK